MVAMKLTLNPHAQTGVCGTQERPEFIVCATRQPDFSI
jgi:hypothetical protein